MVTTAMAVLLFLAQADAGCADRLLWPPGGGQSWCPGAHPPLIAASPEGVDGQKGPSGAAAEWARVVSAMDRAARDSVAPPRRAPGRRRGGRDALVDGVSGRRPASCPCARTASPPP